MNGLPSLTYNSRTLAAFLHGMGSWPEEFIPESRTRRRRGSAVSIQEGNRKSSQHGNPATFGKQNPLSKLSIIVIAAFGVLALANLALAQDGSNKQFSLSSTTFQNNATLPLSMIYDYEYNGTNVCSLNGAPGGDESPELSWTNTPRGTRSFVVTTFDTTAGVTDWGMYNISGTATGLPQNAGVTGSTYGLQVINTYGSAGSNADLNYGGPCPPADYPPNVHHYVFTVYALDTELSLPSSANFPPTALTLYRALVWAGGSGHILATASITGLYSTTP